MGAAKRQYGGRGVGNRTYKDTSGSKTQVSTYMLRVGKPYLSIRPSLRDHPCSPFGNAVYATLDVPAHQRRHDTRVNHAQALNAVHLLTAYQRHPSLVAAWRINRWGAMCLPY